MNCNGYQLALFSPSTNHHTNLTSSRADLKILKMVFKNHPTKNGLQLLSSLVMHTINSLSYIILYCTLLFSAYTVHYYFLPILLIVWYILLLNYMFNGLRMSSFHFKRILIVFVLCPSQVCVPNNIQTTVCDYYLLTW